MSTRDASSLATVAVLFLAFTGCKTAPEKQVKWGDVNDARVAADAGTGTNWLLNGRTNDSKHFSPLALVNDKNVSELGLAWSLDIEGEMGVVSEPIVVDGVIYLSAPLSKVYAVEAVSGKLIWKFDPLVKLNQSLNGSYSARTNGGVAVWNGKVYVGTGDCRLVAIDAATAKQVWEATVCEPSQTGITGAPHVAKGKIVMGFNGSDDGVRGALIAYDAESGKEVWRFWTVPGDPSKPLESKALEMAAKTWSGKDSWKVGGGDVWNAITYDDATGLVIFGTAGAGADYGELAAVKATGEKLFSQCIVAVNADTGEYVWHYQTGTEGVHSENNHIVVADLMLSGEKKHVVLTVPKNGFFYVLDAKTGKLISAKPMVKTTWASSVDLETGKPVLIPRSRRRWTAVDRAQLVADELQHRDESCLCADDGSPCGHESSGGSRREWRRSVRAIDRVGSNYANGTLVGRGRDLRQWRSVVNSGESNFPRAGNRGICGIRSRQWEKTLVGENRLGH